MDRRHGLPRSTRAADDGWQTRTWDPGGRACVDKPAVATFAGCGVSITDHGTSLLPKDTTAVGQRRHAGLAPRQQALPKERGTTTHAVGQGGQCAADARIRLMCAPAALQQVTKSRDDKRGAERKTTNNRSSLSLHDSVVILQAQLARVVGIT